MGEKFIQLRIESDIKSKCDELFKKQGLNTHIALKMLLTHIANTNKTPFDSIFEKELDC